MSKTANNPSHGSGGDYQYTLDFYRKANDTGRSLGSQSITVDFSPAKEWAVFEMCRRAGGDTAILDASKATVAPSWHARLGKPYIAGIVVQVPLPEGQTESFNVPLTYFHDLAQEASTVLVERERLKEGETFRYRVCAFPRQLPRDQCPAGEALDFEVESIVEPIHLESRPLSELLRQSKRCGEPASDSFPVFIRQQVIDESTELMRHAGVNETGGILIGHLYRDADGKELFAEATAQIPARHTEQTSTRLKFTADTWSDVDAAVKIRSQQEMYLGWWHSHNAKAWCKDCPIENRRKCKLSGEFFSTHDVALHRACFPKGYSIALVISDSYANGLTRPLFGWSGGMVAQRGFHILRSEPVAATAPAGISKSLLQGE